MIARKQVDFRKWHDGLAAMAHSELGFAPKAGVMVVMASTTRPENTLPSAGSHPWSSNRGPPNMSA